MPNFQALITESRGLVNYSIKLMLAAALLVFLWGLAKFVFKLGGGEAKVEEGRNMMVWGLIALFVMASVWGLVKFIAGNLNITNLSS